MVPLFGDFLLGRGRGSLGMAGDPKTIFVDSSYARRMDDAVPFAVI